MENQACPCCSGKQFVDCCQDVLEGKVATTPLALMRSRYTAHVCKNMPYILRTMLGAPPDFEKNQARKERFEHCRWNQLEIVDAPEVKPGDEVGVVEFKAHYTLNGVPGILHERSRFIKREGRWYYVAADR